MDEDQAGDFSTIARIYFPKNEKEENNWLFLLGSCNAFMADGDFCTAASVDPNWVVKQARNPGKTFDTHYCPCLFGKLSYVQNIFFRDIRQFCISLRGLLLRGNGGGGATRRR